MHHLANLTALHNQRRLNTLAHTDEIVVDGRDCQQRRNSRTSLVDVAVGEDDVAHAFVHTVLGFLAELVERFAQPFLALFDVEEHRKFLRLESFISYVA